MTVFEKIYDTDTERWQPLKTPLPALKRNEDNKKEHNNKQW